MAIRKPIISAGKEGLIYGIGNILNKLSSFLLIPIYIAFLPINIVGTLVLVELFENLINNFLPLGIAYGMWDNFKKHPLQIKENFSSAFLLLGFLSIVFLLFLNIFDHYFIEFLGISYDIEWIYLFILINIFLNIQTKIYLWYIQYNGKSLQFILISFLQFTGTLIFSIYFVVFNGYGLEGFILGKTISYLFVFVFIIFNIFKNHLYKINIFYFKSMIKFGFPLMLLGLTHPVLTIIDRFIMRTSDMPLDQIAIYSIGYKYGMIINMILVIPMQRVWSPLIYKLGAKKEGLNFHKSFLLYYSIIGMTIFLSMLFFSGQLLALISNDNYVDAKKIIPIITLSYFFYGYKIFFQAGAALSGKTKKIILIPFITVCISIIINYFSIINYGVIGAAYATLISYIIFDFILYRVSNILLPIYWSWIKLIKLYILVSFISCYYIFFIGYETDVSQIFHKLLLMITYFAGLVFFNIIGYREVNGFKWALSTINRWN